MQKVNGVFFFILFLTTACNGVQNPINSTNQIQTLKQGVHTCPDSSKAVAGKNNTDFQCIKVEGELSGTLKLDTIYRCPKGVEAKLPEKKVQNTNQRLLSAQQSNKIICK